MPLLMRPCAFVTSSSIPGIGVLRDRVAIIPSAHGTLISIRFSWVAGSGIAKSVNDAGAGAVFHMASIAASFIFWFSVTVYPLSSPRTTTDSADANPNAEATMIDRFANATWRPLSR